MFNLDRTFDRAYVAFAILALLCWLMTGCAATNSRRFIDLNAKIDNQQMKMTEVINKVNEHQRFMEEFAATYNAFVSTSSAMIVQTDGEVYLLKKKVNKLLRK